MCLRNFQTCAVNYHDGEAGGVVSTAASLADPPPNFPLYRFPVAAGPSRSALPELPDRR